MAKIPPNINKLLTVAGAVKTVLNPTPLGVAMTGANIVRGLGGVGPVSDEQKNINVPRGPKDPVAKQAAKPTPFAQESFSRGPLSKGGLVSHKSISDLEKKNGRY